MTSGELTGTLNIIRVQLGRKSSRVSGEDPAASGIGPAQFRDAWPLGRWAVRHPHLKLGYGHWPEATELGLPAHNER